VLVEVDRQNWRAVAALRAGSEAEGYVATNAISMLQSHYESDWRAVAIEAEGRLVGHARYDVGAGAGAAAVSVGGSESGSGSGPETLAEAGRVEARPAWLGSLMIDERWQGRGFGSAALRMLIEVVWSAADADAIHVAVHPANAGALHFYEREGFVDTERLHDGERLLRLCRPVVDACSCSGSESSSR
jgi:diamine N-acetyltransferase